MENSNIFLLSLIVILAGIILGFFFSLIQLSLLSSFFSFFFLWKKKKIIILFLILFIFGALRTNYAIFLTGNNQLKELNEKEEVIVSGKILGEPEVNDGKQKIVVSVKTPFKGKILVYSDEFDKYFTGEEVKIKGKLKNPPVFEDFNYMEYLERQGIFSVIYYPEIEKIKDNSFLYKVVFNLKDKFREIINENMSYPNSHLLRAMVLGDKKDLSDDLKENFNQAGIRHITAISGMHITILINILTAFLVSIGLLRRKAVLLTLLFISIYVFLIGFPPSAVRAAVMGFGLAISSVLGRLSDSIRFLLFAAFLMLTVNPYLIYDVGFQLSFTAVLGINYLSPFFKKKLKKIKNIFGIRDILSMTFSAQIFTLPILLYHFSYFSLLSPISNLLVVPFVPLIIGFGFLGLLLGLIWSKLSLIIFFPLSLILNYIILISKLVGRISFLSFNFGIPIILIIFYYLILGFFVWKRRRLFV